MPKVTLSSNSKFDKNAPCIELLKQNGFEISLTSNDAFSQGLTGDDDVIEKLKDSDAVIAYGEYYTSKVLDNLPKLKVIARLGVGFDKIDMQSASQNSVAVTITPNGNHQSVAEHAITLMMSLAKSIVKKDTLLRNGEWNGDNNRPIRGQTLGIVGLGRIGRSLATRARGMEMNIIASEPYPDMKFVDENNIKLVELDHLLSNSDFVSIHSPLNEETKGMFNKQKLSLMKKSAYLVNTARGGLIVEKDIIDILQNNMIAGAGLDVFEEEPTSHQNPILKLDNVIVSPHMAGNDTQSQIDMGNEAAQSIIDLYNSKWPEGSIVNKEVKETWNW